MKNILVSGGCGFIGSNFIRYIFNKTNFKGNVINIDCLTYAGHLVNLTDIYKKFNNKRYFFHKIDISNFKKLLNVIKKYDIDTVVHFAAESHVDRSIYGPQKFINTNIIGTFNLLESVRFYSKKKIRLHHISTDEVYGSLSEKDFFYETTPYNPRNPYSASKASSDHLVRAYYNTYNLPITISNCSNNYGPYQLPEKLIPLSILNAIDLKPIPIYGDGKNIRDWLYVEDHCNAIWLILTKGKIGETYNIGGNCEKQNIEVVKKICDILTKIRPRKNFSYHSLITFVKDRPGHDRRYAINCDKVKNELGWKQNYSFEVGLNNTVMWYLNNLKWVNEVKTKEYKRFYKKHYQF